MTSFSCKKINESQNHSVNISNTFLFFFPSPLPSPSPLKAPPTRHLRLQAKFATGNSKVLSRNAFIVGDHPD